MQPTLIFECEGQSLEVALAGDSSPETMRQLLAWLPADITIHCAKIAGCHIYWPSPILAPLEKATDIHSLPPGSFLYYPDRQYLELVYDALQPETASVNYLGRLVDGVDWLRDFATRHRERAGETITRATLRLRDAQTPQDTTASEANPAVISLRAQRMAVWQKQPREIDQLLQRQGHNIPFGPLATADGYFRCVQESLWQLWSRPDRFGDAARRAAAINALELGVARIGHYCHLDQSEAFLKEAIAAIDAGAAPLQAVFEEAILYCSRMTNWVDLHIPWYAANEITRRHLRANPSQSAA
jgi:hypothetical protein